MTKRAKRRREDGELITFEWSTEIMPEVFLCKLPGKLDYVILPKGLGAHNCQGAVIGFGTPKGIVEVQLECADGIEFTPELFAAARHVIDGDLAKTYAKPS